MNAASGRPRDPHTVPLYEYRCSNCGHQFEKIQSFSAPEEKECPLCKGPVEKLLSAPAIQFKGSGWYATDYASKSTRASMKAAAEGESKSDSKSDSKSETKSADKPASTSSDSGSSSSSTTSSTTKSE